MGPERRTRILIVDDSVVMRTLLRAVITTDPALEVAGTAGDGGSALQAVDKLRPDLVLLDVEMPVMDGLLTLKKLRDCAHRPPVIMCSSLTQRGARVTIEALASGASDYVTKPSGQADRETAMRTLATELVPKIKALTRRAVREQDSILAGKLSLPAAVIPPAAPTPASFNPNVVVIGVSTGGPAALDIVLPSLPASFPLPVLVVQHMPELFTGLLAERLNSRCRLKVREAVQGDTVKPGTIFIARGNWHMEVVAAARPGASPALRLNQGPLVNHCRPAVDVLFRSAGVVYGANVLAVILTGMGSDGLAACRVLRASGAALIAQDQASSTVWGMPGAVTMAGLANRVLPLKTIAPEIVRLSGRKQGVAHLLAPAVPGSVA